MNNLQKRWAPVLESIGVSKDHPRFTTLCEYAEIQKNLFKATAVRESVNNANQYNTRGFGDVVMPGVAGTPGTEGTAGSGDIAQTLLPASVKIAAHTPGLNLLPTINVNSNRVDLLYWDWKYDDYATWDNSEQEERGTTFKLDMDKADKDAIKAWLKANGVKMNRGMVDKTVFFTLDGTTLAGTGAADPIVDFETAPKDKRGKVQFLGFARIDNMPMFRIFTQDNAASTGNWSWKNTLNTLPESGSIVEYFQSGENATFEFLGDAPFAVTGDPKAYEVSLLEDVISDFGTNRQGTGMTRGEWDVTTANKIGPDTFVTTVQIGVRHIAATLRLSEINDYQRMHGIDIVARTRDQLVNQLQQEISIEIVEKVKEMGERNRQEVIDLSPTGESIFDMDVNKYVASGLYENTFSLARKLWQKVKSGAFFIKSDGRWGAADYVVCSATMASQLAEMKGYVVLPYQNHNIDTSRSIDAVGSLDGLTIYIDPNMMPGDNTVYLGRVGSNEDPGLKFLAYMLAEQVEITAERTMAPHLYLYSRYAIAEYGFFPQKQYLAIHVHDDGHEADVLW